MRRCHWAQSPLMVDYHDCGVGRAGARSTGRLFEFLILEGAQAGLSWETILRKRENYRSAFHRFDPRRSRAMTSARCARCWPMQGSSATG